MSKYAYVFPGQGAQFPGMGQALCESFSEARDLFEQANDQLGFRLSDIMFSGSEDDLKQTRVTQPAVFVHSYVAFKTMSTAPTSMVAGHSLGEFTALVASGCLSFEDGLRLVQARAFAMQHATEEEPGTMAAILGLDDKTVEDICDAIEEVVVAANYNCPGQLVISGSVKGVEMACEQLKSAGAKRAFLLPVGGAFHSPLMLHAEEKLIDAIESVAFHRPVCPVYQNVVAHAVLRPADIKTNLIHQLTGPVRWTQCVQAMVADGASHFTEAGPGKVLQGLIQKIHKEASVTGIG
jgi:[acyl-carrier-protein] S-malonyltransferase